jgi:prolyl-tRNA synthetase
MRFSHLFGRTIREVPSDADLTSHQLSVRAGLIRQLAAGIYSYLPTGWRVLRKIEQIMRDEMDAIGGQELLMPVVHPAEVWRATGRYDAPAPGPALLRFRDRTGHDMVLAMTHEETATHLALQEIASYRQLPLMIYQIQIKFRDEPRSRGGLVRVREFTMKDAYSFHADFDSLDEFYPDYLSGVSQDFRPLWRAGIPGRGVHRDHGRLGFARVHGDQRGGRRHADPVPRLQLCGQRRAGRSGQGRGGARAGAADGKGAHARHQDHRGRC